MKIITHINTPLTIAPAVATALGLVEGQRLLSMQEYSRVIGASIRHGAKT